MHNSRLSDLLIDISSIPKKLGIAGIFFKENFPLTISVFLISILLMVIHMEQILLFPVFVSFYVFELLKLSGELNSLKEFWRDSLNLVRTYYIFTLFSAAMFFMSLLLFDDLLPKQISLGFIFLMFFYEAVRYVRIKTGDYHK